MIYEGNCLLGDLFINRREKGRAGLPTFSVTLNDGLVNRDDLERKQETSLSSEEHLLVKPDDIAYNMMRMWQGAFGLAYREGIVSPAYVVLQPKPTIDPRYVAYLLKSPRMRYLLWAYSYGLTEDRLRLYFQDFSRIPVTIPPKQIQERSVEILSTWDAAISKAARIRDLTGIQNSALIKDLIRGRTRVGGDFGKWQEHRLGKVANVIVSSVDKDQNDGEISVSLCNYTHVYYRRNLVASMPYDSGYATESEISRFRLIKGDVVITKDSENPCDIGIAAYVADTIPNLVCGYHLAIIRPDPSVVDGRYLSCLFDQHGVRKHFSMQANGVTRFGLPLKAIQELPVLLPTIEEQQQISKIVFDLHQNYERQAKNVEKLINERAAIASRLLSQKAKSSNDNISAKTEL